MSLNRNANHIIIGLAFSFLILPRNALCEEPSLTGEFPFEYVSSIYSGPFTNADKDDLLVLHHGGGIQFSNYDYTGAGTAMGTYYLTLYFFDGAEFRMIWEDRSVILAYSMPLKYPITRTAWCYGDFDNDGRCSIISSNVRDMWEYEFDERHLDQHKIPLMKKIKTPDVWIDQLIACDIDNDGRDELVALEYLNFQDNSGNYKIGIYKIDGDTLVEVWNGLEGKVGGNYEIMPPDHFISTCNIDGIPGEVPVIMGMQSDVSLSHYSVIGKSQSIEYELMRPFPIPQQTRSRRGKRGTKEAIVRLAGSDVGPVGGIIFNDIDKILSYGMFMNGNNILPDAFSLLENDEWRLLEKTDSQAGGELCKFTIEMGRSGWLFIKDEKYRFYEKLPVEE
jgi:hypothetical protein